MSLSSAKESLQNGVGAGAGFGNNRGDEGAERRPSEGLLLAAVAGEGVVRLVGLLQALHYPMHEHSSPLTLHAHDHD